MIKKLKITKRTIFLLLIFCSITKVFALDENKDNKTDFTINYENVSIVEYIQFVSKVCGTNFIYNAQDLNFNITINSKEPVTKQSVMSSLIQVLRINGLFLIEEGGSTIISKSEDVKEVAPIVEKGKTDIKNPIITRILPIKNSPPAAILTLIQSMISTSSIVNLVSDTRQLVITDVTSNVEKVTKLIEELDNAASPLAIETYTIEHNATSTLINLTKQIMAPIIEGNPYILTSQDSTNKIFIVSTDYLAKKTLGVLKHLDILPKSEIKTLENQQLFIYKPVNRSQKDLKNALNDIASNLKKEGMPHPGIIDAIDNKMWIQETGSFVFSATPATVEKLQNLLKSLDSPLATTEAPFYLYNLQYVQGDFVEDSLEKLAKKFKEQNINEPNLLETLQTAKWIKETNSILLTGTSQAIDEVKNIIPQYDTALKSKVNFFIYTPKHASLDDLDVYLQSVYKNLKSSGLSDKDLMNSISTMKVVPTINSIIFTGDEATLAKIQNLINNYDTSKEGLFKGTFLMLTPTYVSLQSIEKAFTEIAKNLQSSGLADQPLLESIASMKIINTTNSVIFTGDEETLKKIQTIFNTINAPASKQAIQELAKTNFWVYQIQKANPSQLVSSIKSLTNDLAKMSSSDQAFIQALQSIRYDKETNSLVFVGTPDALQKIEPLVQRFDVPPTADITAPTYFVYKPTYLTGTELECILCEFAENLKTSNVDNDALFEAIDSMKFSDQTNSLVFLGEPSALDEVKKLLQNFDVPSSGFAQNIAGLDDLGFLVYKLQYHKGDEIQAALKQIAKELKISSTSPTDTSMQSKLLTAIDSIQWVQITNSLLCSGDNETLAKIKELISNLDVPLKQVFIEVLLIQTTLTNALSFGLDWGSKMQYKDQAVLGLNNSPVPANTSTLVTPFNSTYNAISNSNTPNGPDLGLGSGFNLGVIGDILFHKGKSFLSLASLLRALQNDTETSIVLTPKIIAQDGITATIFSGQNIPYSGSVIQNESSNSVITTNLEYRDVGTNLQITPILGNGDTVSLNIQLETSSVPANYNANNNSLGAVNGITTTKTSMSTSVQLANKNFLVLSGMVTDSKNRAKTGIPCLGGIPFIGSAFSRDDTQKTRNNIVIFLRPHIINSFRDMQSVTNSQEDLFREQAGTPTLEKDFDEATELIKSYEND